MENRLKLILFEIIYNKLGLKEIEDCFVYNNIKGKKINNYDKYPILSKYFFLMNDVNLDCLFDIEKEELSKYYNLYCQGDETGKKRLYEFLESNALKLLLPKTDEKYLYWGYTSFEYMAPSDAIVLGFHYIAFDNSTMEEYDMSEKFINNKLNYIQKELAENFGHKVAVIKYDDVPRSRVL